MLQQNKTKKINQVKYALLIPLISLFLYSFTIKEIYQDKNGININSKGSIIVIDAGHGGEDSGATDSGTIEKEIVLQLSKEIKSLYKGAATILLTRNDDTFVSLQDRTDYINKLKPDLLISLHLNTSKNSQDNGIQMYVNAENKNYEKSKLAANNILHNFSEVALAKTSKIYNKNFTILRVNAPAVLLEIGFLSNNKDRNYLNSIKGQQEIAKSIIAFINGKPTVSSSQKGFGFPINKKDLEGMMSGYGMRIHPITKERKMHTGMDLSAKKGVAILAARHGVVTRAEFDKNYGNVVYIEHQNGFQTRYAHMNEIRIKKGSKVLQGTIIGTVGSTGKSLSPHLHFEILKDGNFVDPKNFY